MVYKALVDTKYLQEQTSIDVNEIMAILEDPQNEQLVSIISLFILLLVTLTLLCGCSLGRSQAFLQ